MRLPATLALCALLLPVLCILTARNHIRDLWEVRRTYASYHKYVLRHPEVIYHYPASSEREEAMAFEGGDGVKAPQIIHQIFLQEGRSSSLAKYEHAMASCQELHPTWKHRLWTDDNATSFMQAHYPRIATHYEGYKQSIQRANILRYAILDHFGGVYLDLDVTCRAPLDNLLHLPWVTPGAYPAGVNNAFILTRPHHRFLDSVLARASMSDLSWPMPYVENMLSTGCMFFSNRWMAYVDRLSKLKYVPNEDKVYVLADEDGDMGPHMLRGAVTTPLFVHGGASSWHGWDAAMIVLIGKHYGYFLALLSGMMLLLGLVVARLCTRHRALRRRSRSIAMVRRSTEKRTDDGHESEDDREWA